MTWTAPYDFTTDEVVTAPILDTYVSGNLLSLMHAYGTRETNTITVASTTSETSLYTTPPVLVGGDLGSTGTFEALHHITGDTTADGLTIRIKLGATTVRTILTNASGTCSGGFLRVNIEALGSEASQRVTTSFEEPDGLFTGAANVRFTDTAAVDLTTNQTFNVTVQPDISSANAKLVSLFRKQMLGRN
jgi:hypothetical protein